jgi:hypothetical protein
MRALIPFLVSATACNQLLDIPALDDGPCDSGAGFIQRTVVRGLGTELGVQNARLSRDELTIVFSRMATAGLPDAPVQRFGDLYMAHRDHRDEEFRYVAALDELSSEFDEFSASLSDDLLTVYFDRQDQGSRYRVFSASRPSPDHHFGVPVVVPLGDQATSDYGPFITPTAMFFASLRDSGLSSLFVADRRGSQFDAPRRLISPETLSVYETPVVAFDGLTIYFSAVHDRLSERVIWSATRPDPGQRFGLPTAVAALNTGYRTWPTWISEDNCRLYYMLAQPGQDSALWMASRRAP